MRNYSRVSGKRLYTDNGRRTVLPRAVRRAPPRKERRALAVNEGELGKGDEPGAIHEIPVEGEAGRECLKTRLKGQAITEYSEGRF